MTSRRRTRRAQLLLVAGTHADLAAMRDVLASLPEAGYGQVFVEVESTSEIADLDAPARMTVTWLVGGPNRGEALSGAIAGWAAEWMPETGMSADASLAWIGADASRTMTSLDDLRERVGSLHILAELPQLEPRAARP